MPILVGLDFETTGLVDPRIVGVGLAMYDVTPVTGKRCDVKNDVFSIKATSFLVDPGDVPYEPKAIETHGVTPEIAKKWGCAETTALDVIKEWMAQSDYMVAFNGNTFDQEALKTLSARCGKDYPQRIWIDPFVDLEHENTDDLIGQCAKHGFLFDDAHSALADVTATMRLLFMHDVNRVIEIASSPMVFLKADVSFDEKDLAKVRGYKWHNKTDKKFPEAWVLETRELFKQKEIDEAPFGIEAPVKGEDGKWRWTLLRPKKSSHAGVVEI